MKFSLVSKVVFVLVLIATGFFVAQAMRARLDADSKIQASKLPEKVEDIQKAVDADQTKPRFEGDIDGIYLAPRGASVPRKYTTFADICGKDSFSREASWEEAGQLNLDLKLPAKYVLQDPDLNTGAIACTSNGKVYVARRTYTMGQFGDVTIGRSFFTTEEMDIAVDRPKAERINGRDVVIIDSLTEKGTFQNAYAFFPEPFGETFINATGLSHDDFRELVALVASSTR